MRKSCVAALVIASLASAAQAQTPTSGDRVGGQEQRMTVNGGCGSRRVREQHRRRGLLNGIELSEAERTQLAEVRVRHCTERQALHARQVTEVRGALDTESQRVFDANRAARATRRAEWVKRRDAGGMDGRRGMRGRHRARPSPGRSDASG